MQNILHYKTLITIARKFDYFTENLSNEFFIEKNFSAFQRNKKKIRINCAFIFCTSAVNMRTRTRTYTRKYVENVEENVVPKNKKSKSVTEYGLRLCLRHRVCFCVLFFTEKCMFFLGEISVYFFLFSFFRFGGAMIILCDHFIKLHTENFSNF